MFKILRGLMGRGDQPVPRRRRLTFQQWPAVIYAVGDVHGCLAQLRALEMQIVDDASTIVGEKWILYLGDYIDRGPDSAGVLDVLLASPPPGFLRFCLVGNHEAIALDYLRNPQPQADWIRFGGIETLNSYGLAASVLQGLSPQARRAALAGHIPRDHIDFLARLPLSLSVPGTLFVHAGIRPGVQIDDQREEDLLWIRDAFFDAPPVPGLRVVHGHTPARSPFVSEERICVDTGAFATGVLTAARLTPDGAVKILQATAL